MAKKSQSESRAEAPRKLEMWDIKKIKPYPKNQKKHDDPQVQDLVLSIQRFGNNQPIAIKPDGEILAGHARFSAAQVLSLPKIPVIVVPDLSETEADMYRIADNKLNESPWHIMNLTDSILSLKEIGADLSWTALSAADISKLIDPTIGEKPGDPDAVPETPKFSDVEPGDIFLLGDHRLMCGDSTNLEAVQKLMGGGEADMVFTDPPYNVNYEGKTKDKLKIENDQMGNEDFRQFLKDAFISMYAVTKAGSPIYVCHADSEGYNFRGAMIDAGWLVKQCIIWVKNSLVMGRQDYQWKHEPILYGWKPGTHRWHGDRKQTTVWEIDRPSRSPDHPTTKPVDLIEMALMNSSIMHEVVLDLFGGSGSTLIACEKRQRKCRTMELDPKYCEVIIKRWEEYTEQDALRLDPETGEAVPWNSRRTKSKKRN